MVAAAAAGAAAVAAAAAAAAASHTHTRQGLGKKMKKNNCHQSQKNGSFVSCDHGWKKYDHQSFVTGVDFVARRSEAEGKVEVFG